MTRRQAIFTLGALPARRLHGAGVADFRKIHVNAADARGRIRSLQGVHLGRKPLFPATFDVSGEYSKLRIDSVHVSAFVGPAGSDAVESQAPHEAIFPNWEADPENPQSYQFGPVDQALEAIADTGADICISLGAGGAIGRSSPGAFDKFARVAQHIARHCNDGWAQGRRWGIRRWEIGTEPPNPLSWKGTPEQFHELYDETARALKAYDPSLKVGAAPPHSYGKGFVRSCARNAAPLDFFSWRHDHARNDPYDTVRIGQSIRQLLDENGLASTESHLTAWNLDRGSGGSRDHDSLAAFAASAEVYLQEAPVDVAYLDRGDASQPPGLFHMDGRHKSKAFALLAAGQMLDTPHRLEVEGDDTIGYAVLAGRSAEGDRVQILISNYERTPRAKQGQKSTSAQADAAQTVQPRPEAAFDYKQNQGYDLLIDNLPWGAAEFRVERQRLSEQHAFEMMAEGAGRGGSLRLAKPLPPPGIELIVLEPHDLPVYEKLHRRRRPRRGDGS